MKVNNINRQDVGSKEAASIETEDPCRPLINSIRGMFKTLEPPLTSECCIYRIHGRLRKVNEVAYTPRAISIGPFHRGKEQLQTMEKHKERHLCHFLQRDKVSLEDLVTSIKELEERVRRCYAETIDLNSDELVKMILLDGGFIIEYLLSCCENQWTDENKVLYKPWLKYEIIKDLILLKNQLPFFVLEKLFNLAFSIDANDQTSSFLMLAFDYFSKFNGQNIPPHAMEVKHFTDLVRYSHLPSSPRLLPKENKRNQFSYSATNLREAGVKFKVGSSKCLFDIQFSNGYLKIPPFIIEDIIESLIRNIMALEQCHYPDKTYICDYVILMNTLVNTSKDVELLVQNGIIFNRLGSNDVLATIFNSLCLDIKTDNNMSYFYRLCEDMTEYYKNPWNRWKATLKRDNFNTPWRIASTVAAVILLVLTLMQTVNSFVCLNWSILCVI